MFCDSKTVKGSDKIKKSCCTASEIMDDILWLQKTDNSVCLCNCGKYLRILSISVWALAKN